MIIGTIFYALLEQFLKQIEGAIAFIAGSILDESITVFSANQNIFETFIDMIPFSANINLAAIIKGLAYGLVILLMIVSIVKSFASPITGDDAVNPAQAAIKAAVAIILIMAIFGTSFGFASSHRVYYSGLLQPIGSWFGTILSKVGDIPERITNGISFDWGRDPRDYFGAILLELALLTSLLGAALQYVERIIGFAIYMILGPIAIAMYASSETEQTAKDWIIGVVSQFLAIFVSLVAWSAFITAANDTHHDSLLNYAVLLALLGVMRNSEKILNAFGLKTMRLGDSARSLVAGWGMLTTAVMMGSRFISSNSKKVAGGSFSSAYNSGVVSPFTKDGQLATQGQMNMARMQQTFSNPISSNQNMLSHPVSSIKNASSQNRAMSAVQNAMANGQYVDAKTLNNALGLSNKSTIQAVGTGKDSIMNYATVKSESGQEIKGFIGTASITKNGETELAKNVFFPSVSPGESLANGAISSSFAGSENLYIKGGGPIFADGGIYAYRTIDSSSQASFSDMKNSVSEIQQASEDAGLEKYLHSTSEPKIVSRSVHEAKN